MTEISYLADKVYIHHWPKDTPVWNDSRKSQVEQQINQNKEKKRITVKDDSVKIENFEFKSLKKIGIDVPFFQKQSTMIFEGHCEEFDAHVHVRTREEDYLETFNKLMVWRKENFPESLE